MSSPTQARLWLKSAVIWLCRLPSSRAVHDIPCCTQVVFEEAGERKIIFSSFDPDCATLARLKQPRWPIFFLTCAGEKVHHFSLLIVVKLIRRL